MSRLFFKENPMKKRGERTCIICGKKYEYCPHCGKGKPQEGWRNLYDSLDCKAIFLICSDFVNKRLSAAEAKQKLEKYDLKDLSTYAEGIRENIKAINAAAPAKKEKAEKAPAPVKAEKVEKSKENKDGFVNAKKD